MDAKVHYINISPEERKKLEKKKFINCLAGTIIGTVIYSIGVSWILLLGGFFSGGATGLSQLIVGLFEKYGPNQNFNNFIANNLGTFVMLINVPLLIFSWKGLSKNFAILTLISIIVQSLVLNLLTMFTISPLVYLIKTGGQVIDAIGTGTSTVGSGLFDVLRSSSFQFFKGAGEASLDLTIFQTTMLPGTRLMLAILGGVVTGFGAAVCLKSGGSTGGMDIIANYFQVRKQISFTKISGIVDGTIILLSSFVSLENVIYTLIRLVVYVKTVDITYNAYKTNRLEIITEKRDEMREALLANIHHSMTLYQCVGGFTNRDKTAFVIYASRFELPKYTSIIKEVDPGAFITFGKVEILSGNYIQSTIA